MAEQHAQMTEQSLQMLKQFQLLQEQQVKQAEQSQQSQLSQDGGIHSEDDEEEELNKRVKMTTDEKGRLLINDTTVVNTLYMEGGSMLATLLVKKFASKKDTDRKERGKKLLEILKKVARIETLLL